MGEFRHCCIHDLKAASENSFLHFNNKIHVRLKTRCSELWYRKQGRRSSQSVYETLMWWMNSSFRLKLLQSLNSVKEEVKTQEAFRCLTSHQLQWVWNVKQWNILKVNNVSNIHLTWTYCFNVSDKRQSELTLSTAYRLYFANLFQPFIHHI